MTFEFYKIQIHSQKKTQNFMATEESIKEKGEEKKNLQGHIQNNSWSAKCKENANDLHSS